MHVYLLLSLGAELQFCVPTTAEPLEAKRVLLCSLLVVGLESWTKWSVVLDAGVPSLVKSEDAPGSFEGSWCPGCTQTD